MFDLAISDPALGVLAWLLTYLLHSTILIGAIWCVLRLRLVRSAGVEDTLWKIGLVGALLTATLQAGAGLEPLSGTYTLGPDVHLARDTDVPPVEVDIALGVLGVEGAPPLRFAFREAPALRERRLRAPPFLATSTASPAFDPEPAALRLVSNPTTDAVPVMAEPALGLGAGGPWSGVEGAPREASRSPSAWGMSWLARHWAAITAGLWVLLAVFGLARYVQLRHRLRKALGTRTPVQSIRMLSILGRLEHRAGIQGAVSLTCSPFLSGPVALGRREICVPRRAVTDLEPRQQEALLAHELAHIRRRDPQWLNLCALIEAVFFFQPLNRLARARLQAVSEFLCDDWAVDSTGRRVTMAQCLAEVASWIEDTRDVLPVAGMARPDSSLLKRVRRIADRPPRQRVLRRSASTLLALALLGGVSCGVPSISSGLGEGSLLEQLKVLVRSTFHALSPAAVETQQGEAGPPAAPASGVAQDAPDAPEPAEEREGIAPQPDVDPGPAARFPFRQRLQRPGAPGAPLAVRRLSPPVAPSPTRSLRVTTARAPHARWPLGDQDDQDDTIVLRIVDGQAVGVDASGRTFRIVGVDKAGDGSSARIEIRDGRLHILDGEGETIVLLDLDQDDPEPDEGHVGLPFDLDHELDIDRALRDIEREYEQQMRGLDGALRELQRGFDVAQRELSREFETAVEQGQREYDAALEEWTRAYEVGSKEMIRVQERMLEEFERGLRDLQREWADKPAALEEHVEEWEDRFDDWEAGFEDDWEEWERSIEEQLEGLEEEYETWWEELEGGFDQAFEELEEEYESGMEGWEFEIEELEDRYEAAFAEWEVAYEGFADRWEGRDCDHECERACADGCTHPDEAPAPECAPAPDVADEVDEADAT